nr:hypothetical protein [Pseudomonas boanensis]
MSSLPARGYLMASRAGADASAALPVRAQGRLVGNIALHWPRDQDSVERVRQRHLVDLAGAIDQLQHSLG